MRQRRPSKRLAVRAAVVPFFVELDLGGAVRRLLLHGCCYWFRRREVVHAHSCGEINQWLLLPGGARAPVLGRAVARAGLRFSFGQRRLMPTCVCCSVLRGMQNAGCKSMQMQAWGGGAAGALCHMHLSPATRQRTHSWLLSAAVCIPSVFTHR